jgi:hypothetical protein
MILPLIVGFLAGKSYGKNVRIIVLSLIAGILMGICGGLELIPFAYPFYATRPLDWMGLPEYRPIAIYFGFPFFKLYQEVVLMTEVSGLIITILTLICILGVLIGYAFGTLKYKKKDQVWSAEQK